MAKIKSGQLAGAQGKVGSIVYQKSASGDTVARSYVIPKNPKTLAQRFHEFIVIGSSKYAHAAVFVSEGSLAQVYTSIAGGKLVLAGVAANTYKAVMDACHAQRGLSFSQKCKFCKL
jgi:hypothetical protein